MMCVDLRSLVGPSSLERVLREIEGEKVMSWRTEDESWCLRFPPAGGPYEVVELRVVGSDFLELVKENGERTLVPYASIKRVTIAKKPWATRSSP